MPVLIAIDAGTNWFKWINKLIRISKLWFYVTFLLCSLSSTFLCRRINQHISEVALFVKKVEKRNPRDLYLYFPISCQCSNDRREFWRNLRKRFNKYVDKTIDYLPTLFCHSISSDLWIMQRVWKRCVGIYVWGLLVVSLGCVVTWQPS